MHIGSREVWYSCREEESDRRVVHSMGESEVWQYAMRAILTSVHPPFIHVLVLYRLEREAARRPTLSSCVSPSSESSLSLLSEMCVVVIGLKGETHCMQQLHHSAALVAHLRARKRAYVVDCAATGSKQGSEAGRGCKCSLYDSIHPSFNSSTSNVVMIVKYIHAVQSAIQYPAASVSCQ